MMKRPEITRLTIIVAAAAVAGLLFIWGTFRVGTADVVLPERMDQPEKIQKEQNASYEHAESGHALLHYDSRRYVRSSPMADPFFLRPAAEHLSEENKGTVLLPEDKGPSVPEKQNPVQEKRPILLGIISMGTDRRALLQEDEKVSAVARHDQWKEWYVESIEEQSVVLSGNGKRIRLSIEETL